MSPHIKEQASIVRRIAEKGVSNAEITNDYVNGNTNINQIDLWTHLLDEAYLLERYLNEAT